MKQPDRISLEDIISAMRVYDKASFVERLAIFLKRFCCVHAYMPFYVIEHGEPPFRTYGLFCPKCEKVKGAGLLPGRM